MNKISHYKLRAVNYFRFNRKLNNKKGQVVIILLLIALVGLAIALAITQRSVTDLSTSTQNDQSSRAFSAAEAGIETAIANNYSSAGTFPISGLGSDITANVKVSDKLPQDGSAVEFPKGTNKDGIVHFWLANPESDLSSAFFNPTSIIALRVYFGDQSMNPETNETLALEINVVSKNAGNYISKKYFIDPNDSRRGNNGFREPTSEVTQSIATILGSSRSFKAYFDIPAADISGIPILIRIRPLYTSSSHPIAVRPMSSRLPGQILIYTSQGQAGQSTKVIQYITQQYAVPAFLDYAIFSNASIEKN